MSPKEPKLSPWQKVLAAKQKHKCSCPIKPGMTWVDLRPLSTGCTNEFVCPVLRAYREAVGIPSPDDYVNETPNTRKT